VFARWSGGWYRAMVVNRNKPSKSIVYFIDYGNEAEVSNFDLRTMPADIAAEPPAAILISLRGTSGAEGQGYAMNKQLEALIEDRWVSVRLGKKVREWIATCNSRCSYRLVLGRTVRRGCQES
jgi:hypothetical protein